jgi:orotidine-5'-phosphate decarboxylase
MNPRERLIVALDVPSLDAALRLADSIAPYVGRFKVGLELFSRSGPECIRLLAERAPVMLDLKLHDIPATVSRAAEALAALEVEMITLHAGGGTRMMREAAAAAPKVKLLAVTLLTSLDKAELNQLGITGDVKEVVAKRATLAVTNGCAGVVTSPREASMLRRLLGPKPLIVTPGVRPQGCDEGDQKRTATPREAIAAGADLVVVGRPIRDAANPAEAARNIVNEIEAGLSRRCADVR